jgi:hypothetical protein
MLVKQIITIPREMISVEILREHAFGEGHVAQSHVLVCPVSGQPWAYLLIEGDDYIEPRGVFCPLHTQRAWNSPVPGSILYEEAFGLIDSSLLKALPDELVRREFKLHLKEVEE